MNPQSSLLLYLTTCWLVFGHIPVCWVVARVWRPGILPLTDTYFRLAFGVVGAMLLNALYVLAVFGFGFSAMRVALVAVALDVVCLAVILIKFRSSAGAFRLGWLPVLVLAVLSLALLSGGVTDILADSWWHMARADQFMDQYLAGEVAGKPIDGQILEPTDFRLGDLWIGVVAWAGLLTGSGLPWVWDAMTVWVAVFTVITYYLLGRTLSGSKGVGLLAAILFLILMGGLNSGMRLSAWPAGLSYALLYLAISEFIRLFARIDSEPSLRYAGPRTALAGAVRLGWPSIMVIALICLLILLQHPGELFLFGMSVLCYCLIVGFSNAPVLNLDRNLLFVPALLVLAAMITLSHRHPYISSTSTWLFTGVLAGALILAALRRWSHNRGYIRPARAIPVIVLAAVCVGIDWGHVAELFRPVERPSNYYKAYIPHYLKGFFGEWVRLPQWGHQLRDGLLWAGLLSIPVSAWVYIMRPTRGHAFLLANTLLPFVVLVSTYVFTFLTTLVPEEGVYRIHLLIFHPIILAIGLVEGVKLLCYRPHGQAARLS